MNLATFISIVVLVLVVSLAIRYIIREKKRGTVCIGCPNAGSCQKYGKKHSTSGDFSASKNCK